MSPCVRAGSAPACASVPWRTVPSNSHCRNDRNACQHGFQNVDHPFPKHRRDITVIEDHAIRNVLFGSALAGSRRNRQQVTGHYNCVLLPSIVACIWDEGATMATLRRSDSARTQRSSERKRNCMPIWAWICQRQSTSFCVQSFREERHAFQDHQGQSVQHWRSHAAKRKPMTENPSPARMR